MQSKEELIKTLNEPLIFSNINASSKNKDFLMDLDALKKLASNNDASAQLLIGLTFLTGDRDCIKDWKEGEKWIVQAAKNNDTPAGLCAQGICYEYAIGGVNIINLDKAKQFYSKAAEKGYIPAISALAGLMYNEGITTTTSEGGSGAYYQSATHIHVDREKLKEAVKLYTLCAEEGYAPALCRLGECYYYGYGITKNYAESFKVTKRAAEAGLCQAKFNLGGIYKNGNGIDRNYSSAREWFSYAAKQGHKGAVQELASTPLCECSIL